MWPQYSLPFIRLFNRVWVMTVGLWTVSLLGRWAKVPTMDERILWWAGWGLGGAVVASAVLTSFVVLSRAVYHTVFFVPPSGIEKSLADSSKRH